MNANHIKAGAVGHGNPAHLLPSGYKRQIAAWLEEDTPSFDYGGFVVGDDPAEARLLAKSEVHTKHFLFHIYVHGCANRSHDTDQRQYNVGDTSRRALF